MCQHRAVRILVLGTVGQLATELRRTFGAPAELELWPAERVELADEAAVRGLLERARPDVVINAAAYTAVDKAEQEPERAFAVNEQGPRTLASYCHAAGACLVHVSTDYVFDGRKASPYLEDDAIGPLNVYGRSKWAGEQAIRAELEQHLILRTSWVFSAHGQNFVKTMLRLGQDRTEVRVVADQYGRPTPAHDLAEAIWHIVRARAQGAGTPWGTYHFAGEGTATWKDLAEAVFALAESQTGKHVTVTPISTADYPTPAQRPRSSVLDSTRFASAFGRTPQPWQVGLKRVVDELLAPNGR